MRRPAGMIVVATSAILLGAGQIFVSLGYFRIAAFDFLTATWLRGDVSGLLDGVVYLMGISLIILGLLGIVFAIGALTMRRWAWGLGLTTYIVAIGGSIFVLLAAQTAVTAAVTGVASALMAWYLSTEDVRQAFGQETMATGGQRPHAV